MKIKKKENKHYKYSISKIYKEVDVILMSEEIKSIKGTSHDIINTIDNLENIEGSKLNKYSTEDELLLKYQNEIKDNKNPIARSEDYKKAVKYLRDNGISNIIIHENKPIIIGYLRLNNINLETLRNAILENDKKIKKNIIKIEMKTR